MKTFKTSTNSRNFPKSLFLELSDRDHCGLFQNFPSHNTERGMAYHSDDRAAIEAALIAEGYKNER